MSSIVESFPLTAMKERGKCDLFIVSASYESRCLSIASAVTGANIGWTVIFENLNHQDLHKGYGEKLSQLLPNSQFAYGSTENPLATADALQNALLQQSDAQRLLIDISTFTHEALLILIRILRNTHPHAEILCVYTAAKEYSIGDPDDKKWLSRGIKEVRSVLGFPGRLAPSKRLHLVLLAGVEHDRATELVRWYEPSRISLGYSVPRSDASRQHSELRKQRFALLKSFFAEASEFRFDAYDPLATKTAVLEQCHSLQGYNVVVAPMNNKLSTLGAAWAGLEDQAVQLCYSQALIYNTEGYSEPGDTCYSTPLLQPAIA